MTCKDCIHSGLCYKENDYENFPERCGSFIPERTISQGEWIESENAINTVIPNEWQTEIIEIRKYYAKCPYCEFSFEMEPHRELPYFCGACGRRLRGKEE